MVKVYFEMEQPKYAELVAQFQDSELYNACLPGLEKLLKKRNFDFITESVEDEEL